MLSLTSQELLYLIGTICLLFVSGFLCWALYEIARLVHQANQVMDDTREKISRFERAVVMIGEKLGASAQYLGFIAEGGKQLLSYFSDRRKENADHPPAKKGKKGQEDALSDMPDDV